MVLSHVYSPARTRGQFPHVHETRVVKYAGGLILKRLVCLGFCLYEGWVKCDNSLASPLMAQPERQKTHNVEERQRNTSIKKVKLV